MLFRRIVLGNRCVYIIISNIFMYLIMPYFSFAKKFERKYIEEFQTLSFSIKTLANVQKPSFVPATLKNVATLAKLRKKIFLKIRSLKIQLQILTFPLPSRTFESSSVPVLLPIISNYRVSQGLDLSWARRSRH